MAKPRPAPPKEAPVVTPEVTPAVEAPKVEAAPEAPVKAPATPAVEAVAVVPVPVAPPSPFDGFVPGWMPVEFDSVPDESGRVTRIKGHTWGFVPAPKPGS